MNSKQLYIVSFLAAILPMLTMTIIFWFWFFYPKLHDFELWGIRVILISIPICIVGLMMSFIVREKNKENNKLKKKTTQVILLTLGNIPMAIFYVGFALYMMNIERITIVNNSKTTIKNIHIFGVGDDDKIKQLEKGKSKTVWVYMKSEGSIQMKYSQNDQTDTIYLRGYTGPGMGGGWGKYNIKEGDLKK